MSRILSRCWKRLAAPDVRSIFWWCLPALLLGLALRVVLCVQMPRAFYHPDSEQLFSTWHYLLRGSLQIHEKKTPLGPLLYCLPPLLHLPVLPVIAFVQHLLGLGIVAVTGALVAKSFAHGRVFIVPVTLAVALNPILLWYEHTALPETFYVFSIVAIALAALAYARRPEMPRLLALATALFLTAGLRPEGKLFCLFGIALVVALTWGDWRRARVAVSFMVLLTFVCFVLNQTRQSGSLLYSNVAHLTPAHLRSAPGFAEEYQAYFAGLKSRWAVTPTGGIAHERKQIIIHLREYLARREGSREKAGGAAVNRLCSRIGAEVCLRNLTALPELTLTKFRFALRNATAEDFGPDWVWRRQAASFAGDDDGPDHLADPDSEAVSLARIVLGKTFASRVELETYLRQIFHPFSPDWLTAYEVWYASAEAALRLPDGVIRGKELPGLPLLYLCAGLGLIALAIRDRRLRSYHFLWFGMLLGMLVILTLTGSNLGRFRIGFEPFWVLYACGVPDVLLSLVTRRKASPSSRGRRLPAHRVMVLP